MTTKKPLHKSRTAWLGAAAAAITAGTEVLAAQGVLDPAAAEAINRAVAGLIGLALVTLRDAL